MTNRFHFRRPSPSMAVALLALFVALGGTATAAVVITSTKQIRNGVVTGGDLRNGTVGERDLRDGAVTLDKLQGSARSAIEAAGTQAVEAFRKTGPEGVGPGATERVATLLVATPGTYAIFAKTVLTATQPRAGLLNQGQSIGGHCVLNAAGDEDHARSLLGTPGANAPGELSTQITRGLEAASEVTLTCDVQDATWRASDTSIIAVRVGSAPRQAVEG